MRRITNNSLRRKELFDNVKPLRDSLNLISIIAIKEMHWMGGFDSYRNEICWTLAATTRSCEGIPQTNQTPHFSLPLPLQGSKMRISVQIRRWHPTNENGFGCNICRGNSLVFDSHPIFVSLLPTITPILCVLSSIYVERLYILCHASKSISCTTGSHDFIV